MMVSELWGRHRGEDIYVVGTGPSLRVFPLTFLADRLTIGLNEAYRHLACRYYLSCHPEVAVRGLRDRPSSTGRWLVKRKRPLSRLPRDDPRFYFFDAGYRAEARDPAGRTAEEARVCLLSGGDWLWQSGGAHTTAISAALNMGARAVFLVGCDMGSLGGEHHGHDQPVMFRGYPPGQIYYGYRLAAARLRRAARELLGVPVLSLTPFLGTTAAEEDYGRLKTELGLPDLPPPRDHTEEHRERMSDSTWRSSTNPIEDSENWL